MRNANKSPKIPYSAMLREVDKWSGIRIIDRTTITVWTVVQTVLTATFNSCGNRQISTPPHKIDTPELINKKVGTIDYVHERTTFTKYGTNPPTKGFWANGWNITKKYFLFISFFLRFSYSSDQWMDFYVEHIKRREITQGCAFFGKGSERW